MKRGTPDERTLAYIGIVLWGIWAVLSALPPSSLIGIGVSAAGIVLGLREIKQWQAGELLARGRKAGTPVYPRWAWFAVGAVPTAVIVTVFFAVGGSSEADLFLPSAIGWIAGGFGAQSLLVARADRRAAPGVVPQMPPPPPRPDPA